MKYKLKTSETKFKTKTVALADILEEESCTSHRS